MKERVHLHAQAWIPKLALTAVCLLLGMILAAPIGPVLVLGLAMMLGFAAFCAERPGTALTTVIMLLVAMPQYIILYLPGIPALPVSLGPLGVLSTVLVLHALTSRDPLPRPHSAVVAAFLAYGAAMLLAGFVAGNKDGVMLFVRVFFIPALVFVTTLFYTRSSMQTVRMMDWLLAAACLAAAFAVVEYATKQNYLIEKFVINADIDADLKVPMSMWYLGPEAFNERTFIYRCFSFFTNPLEFGTCMTMMYPYALVRAATSSVLRQRRLYAIGAVACAVGTVLTFSRGPVIALVLSTVALVVFIRRLRRPMAVATGCAVLCLAAAWPILGSKLQDRVNEVDNVTARFKFWEAGAHIFADHPLFGVGLSQYGRYQGEAIRIYKIGPFIEYGGDIDKISTVDNNFIQLAAEAGAIGIGSYVVLLALFFRALRRTWRRHPIPTVRHTALAIGLGACNYLFNGLTITSYVLFIITVVLTFFMASAAMFESEVRK